MAVERKERVLVTDQQGYQRKDRVVEYERSTQQIIVSRTNQLIILVMMVINILLTLRFFLQIIAANAGNVFVDFIYTSTRIFVAPFQTIVSNPTFGNGGVIDFGSLFAIVAYSIVAWLLISLINILFADTGGTRSVTTYEKRR